VATYDKLQTVAEEMKIGQRSHANLGN